MLIKAKRSNNHSRNSGFSLIELIVGIVIIGISLSVITTMIYPLFVRSVEPMLQIRAAEYAQAIMQDILSKRYDETTPVGGQPICSPCTAAGSLGPDGGAEVDRRSFNDVDDYDRFCGGGTPATAIQDILGADLGVGGSGEYQGYLFESCVVYAGAPFVAVNQTAKRITVTVQPPGPATPVTISAYRGNY